MQPCRSLSLLSERILCRRHDVDAGLATRDADVPAEHDWYPAHVVHGGDHAGKEAPDTDNRSTDVDRRERCIGLQRSHMTP
jgi:hypothetical protein